MKKIHTDSPLVQRAHSHIADVLRKGDIAIDATVGNGNDTCFLAKQVGETGLVYGFDIQQNALDKTREALRTLDLEKQVKLLIIGHEKLKQEIPVANHTKIRAVMFNLGYLPGSDKHTITRPETTTTALDAAVSLLASSGIITVLCYLGHHGGEMEYEAVKQWCKELNSDDYQVEWEVPNTSAPAPPQLFSIRKHY